MVIHADRISDHENAREPRVIRFTRIVDRGKVKAGGKKFAVFLHPVYLCPPESFRKVLRADFLLLVDPPEAFPQGDGDLLASDFNAAPSGLFFAVWREPAGDRFVVRR